MRRLLTRARPGLAPRAPMFATRARDDVAHRSVTGAAHRMVFSCILGPADFRDLRSLGDRGGTTEIRFVVKEDVPVPVGDTLPSTENRQGGEGSASDACRKVRDAVDATGRELKEKSAEEALEDGCLDTVLRMILGGRLQDKKYLCHAAARSGQLKELKLLRAAGCPWDEDTCKYAAKGGHLEVLKWLRENGCPWNEWTCEYAAKNGHLEVLKWLRENDCPWDEWTCASAAEGGHLEVLKWLRDNDFPWDEDTCNNAAKGGQLDVLRWARENGCPWDYMTCFYAAGNGHLELLRWARDNGAPWDEDTREIAASKGYVEP